MSTVHALLVGINAYPADGNVPALRGCAPDALAVSESLVRRLGVPRMHVRTLLDGEATHAGVLDAWRTHLVDNLQPGDVAWFHYSGHGSMARTTNPSKPSGFDESLVLWDSRLPQGRDLRDEELAALMAEVQARGVQLILFLDCCHAGGATRADESGAGGSTIIRACPPDLRPALTRSVTEGVSASGGPSPIVLAACLDEEKAAESVMPGGWHGAATWFFLQALEQAHPTTTWAQLYDAITVGVRSRFPRQTPQLTGPADTLLLGGAGVPLAPALLVLEVAGRRLRVDGGLALGVGPGARLALYASGASADAPPIARATVAEATVDTAWAMVEDEALADGKAAVAVEPAARARILAYGYEASVVGVAAEDPALRQALHSAETPFLRLAEPETALYHVGVEGGYATIADASGAPLASVVAPIEDAPTILRALEHLAAFRSIRALRNRAVDPALRGAFTLSEPYALRSSRGRGGGAVSPLPRINGALCARPDQPLRWTVANQSDQRLFVTLLALGPEYSVTRIEPVEGRQTTLGAGRTLDILLRTPPLPPGETQAVLLLKLCVTSAPISFDALLLPPLRGAPSTVRRTPVRDAGPLTWLFDSLRRTGTRPVRPLGGDSADDQWITHDVEILLRAA